MTGLRTTLRTAFAALALLLVVPVALAAPALAQLRGPSDDEAGAPTAVPATPTVISHSPSVWVYVAIVAATVLVTAAVTLGAVALTARRAPQLRPA
jgi:hypothetical protein